MRSCWLILASVLACRETQAASRNNFRTCSTSPFCQRYTDYVKYAASNPLPGWTVDSHKLHSDHLTLKLTSQQVFLQANVTFYSPGFLRLTINEDPLPPFETRFRLPTDQVLSDSLLDTLKLRIQDIVRTDDKDPNFLTFQFNTTDRNPPQSPPIRPFRRASKTNELTAHLQLRPFQLYLLQNDKLVSIVNSQNLLNFEHTRSAPMDLSTNLTFTHPPLDATYFADPPHSLYSHYFAGQLDHIRKGPQAVGLDISYCDVASMHGLAEHAVSWDLPDKYPNAADVDGEPYRFWNSDVFEYELESPMAIYTSVPLLHVVHGQGQSVWSVTGTLWLNPAETFVKLDRGQSHEFEFRGHKCRGSPTWWASETGLLDVIVYFGSSVSDIVRQYHVTSGLPAMQQMSSLAWHQSRWNYESAEDVEFVSSSFDKHGIPLDYIWLDIDHSVHRKYFTWNDRFKDPQAMTDKLSARKRNLVVIVDPHVKAEAGYSVYDAFAKKNLFVKEPENDKDFSGWCWPGDSRYPDVLMPDTWQAYADLYKPSNWVGTQPSPAKCNLPSKEIANWLNSGSKVQLWNDMNEPSVFNKAEVTIPRDVLHYNGRVEHRAVHNLYGLYFHRATFEALRAARKDNRRPFILARAGFIGSHRYGAIWTGDNAARWDHLRISIPMLLHLSACGLSFVGADITGFFENPNPELYIRWIQLGAWYPFSRTHATLNTQRREPYVLPLREREISTAAIKMRYRLLPFWYTTMAKYSLLGVPVLSSIGDFELRFSTDESDQLSTAQSLQRDDGFIVGDTFFVRPILHSHIQAFSMGSDADVAAVAQSFVFPGSPNITWYSLHTGLVEGRGTSVYTVPGSKDTMYIHGPVFVKGGSIIFTKERHRRSSEAQRFDPYSISIYVDLVKLNGTSPPPDTALATGSILLDDLVSDDSIEKKEFDWLDATFNHIDGNLLEFKLTSQLPSRAIGEWTKRVSTKVERIQVFGLGGGVKQCHMEKGEKRRDLKISRRKGIVALKVAKNIDLLDLDWSIKCQYKDGR